MLFAQSRAFRTDLTSLYDFVNPTAAALLNLRWQAAGCLSESRTASYAELQSRFASGIALGNGNLKRSRVDTSWDSQLEQLGAMTLYKALGHLEGWVDSLPVGPTKSRKALLFPDTSQEALAGSLLAKLTPSREMQDG